jgi:hypothetical protein
MNSTINNTKRSTKSLKVMQRFSKNLESKIQLSLQLLTKVDSTTIKLKN